MRTELSPSRFIAATVSTASPSTSRVLGHDNGASSVDENTTLGRLVSAFVAASSAVASSADTSESAANPDIRRYVFAPIRIV